MKKIIIPQHSEYIDKKGNIYSTDTDIIVEVTKKEFLSLLTSKIGYNNYGETAYIELYLDDGVNIKVKLNDILFNPKNLKTSDNKNSNLQDVYLDEGTDVTIDLGNGTGYEGQLSGVLCPKIKLEYANIVKLMKGNHLSPLKELNIKQDDGNILHTDISKLRLVN